MPVCRSGSLDADEVVYVADLVLLILLLLVGDPVLVVDHVLV